MVGKKKAITAVVLCMALAAVFVGLLAWHSRVGEGDSGSGSETSPAEVSEEDGASPLRLSSWDRFGEFWEGCAEGEAAYSEAEPGGAARCYRLREGYEPGPGVDERSHAALLGAERVGLSSEGAGRWDLAAVDCSTGEVSWWAMSSEVAARLSDPEADLGVLREQGVVPLDEGRWVVYADEPQVASDSGVGDPIDGMDYRTLTSEEMAIALHDKVPDDMKMIAYARLDDDVRVSVRQAIVELYGVEELSKYE